MGALASRLGVAHSIHRTRISLPNLRNQLTLTVNPRWLVFPLVRSPSFGASWGGSSSNTLRSTSRGEEPTPRHSLQNEGGQTCYLYENRDFYQRTKRRCNIYPGSNERNNLQSESYRMRANIKLLLKQNLKTRLAEKLKNSST